MGEVFILATVFSNTARRTNPRQFEHQTMATPKTSIAPLYVVLSCDILCCLVQEPRLLNQGLPITNSMSLRELPLSNIRDQPKSMQRQPTSPQSQLHLTPSSRAKTHPIILKPGDEANVSQNPKTNLYSRSSLPVNTQKHTGSEKSALPKGQSNLIALNVQQGSPKSDTRSTIINWLAAIQTFEKPPAPVSIADPAPRNRLVQIIGSKSSKSLDLRIKSRSEQPKASIHLKVGSVYVHPGTNSSISNAMSQSHLPKSVKHTPPGQLNTVTETALPVLLNTTGASKKLEPVRKSSNEANTSEAQKKLEKHKREEKQEQLEAVTFSKAGEGATSKTANEAVRAVKGREEHPEASRLKKADGTVRAEVMELVVYATAIHKKDQERRG